MKTTKRQNVMTKKRKSRRQIAQAITDDLFTNGGGMRAHSLSMYSGGWLYLGFWCETAVYNRILKHLQQS